MGGVIHLAPPLPCVAVCAWDPYHAGKVKSYQAGLIVCEACERPIVCLEHKHHGAFRLSGRPIRNVERAA
jgi:hypothetical protein